MCITHISRFKEFKDRTKENDRDTTVKNVMEDRQKETVAGEIIVQFYLHLQPSSHKYPGRHC